MNYTAWIASLLIAAVYINFLRRIDVFEREKKRNTVICFVLGMLFLLLLYPIHLAFPMSDIPDDNGPIVSSFIFHLTQVAVFEEIVKILPFLVMLLFKDVVNEPFDYIKYSSVGAMGFAALENVQYFNEYSLHIIEGRAFYTAILHMFTSSVIGYMLMRNRIIKNIGIIPSFIGGYIIAVFIHALFNTLVSHAATLYGGITLIIFILVVWGRMMNNALNNSPFFNDSNIRPLVFRAAAGLFIGWLGVFVFAAVALSIKKDISEGLSFISEGIIFLLLSGGGLFIGLGRPDIRKGIWYPLFRRPRKEQGRGPASKS